MFQAQAAHRHGAVQPQHIRSTGELRPFRRGGGGDDELRVELERLGDGGGELIHANPVGAGDVMDTGEVLFHQPGDGAGQVFNVDGGPVDIGGALVRFAAAEALDQPGDEVTLAGGRPTVDDTGTEDTPREASLATSCSA